MPILFTFSKIFEKIVEKRNENYDNHKYPVIKVNRPVISIGNISTGGTGKTPVVEFIAKLLIQKGIKPGIIGKGYKRKNAGVCVVCDGSNHFASIEDSGDEMLMLARKLKVPVVVHEKKHNAAIYLAENFRVDVIIVDDGFQHRGLHRDIDIVILDEKSIAKPYLVPKGRLREPLSSLNRADIILINNSITIPENLISQYQSKIIRFETKFSAPYNIRFSKSGILDKDNVYAFCGIANPKRFIESLWSINCEPAGKFFFRDHYKYSRSAIEFIIGEAKDKKCNFLITTEKDAVKLALYLDIFKDNSMECFVLPMIVEINEGKENLIKKISNLKVIS